MQSHQPGAVGPKLSRDAAQAAPILEGFPPARLLGFFEKLGLPCRELAEGRMYPYSLQAASVLDTLYRRLEDLGVTVRCDFPVSELRTAGKGGFALVSQTGERTSAGG